jgi:hypothetical protein
MPEAEAVSNCQGLFRLTVRLPGGADFSVYSHNLSRIREAYVKYLPNFIMYEEPWIRPLASGLWVQLPFLFEQKMAADFKWDLEYATCEVMVMAAPAISA